MQKTGVCQGSKLRRQQIPDRRNKSKKEGWDKKPVTEWLSLMSVLVGGMILLLT